MPDDQDDRIAPSSIRWRQANPVSAQDLAGWGEAMAALRELLDTVAAARPDGSTSVALAADLADWSRRLAIVAVPENDQLFGRLGTLPGRGQTMLPTIAYEPGPDGELRGELTFGPYFLGGNGAAHGGAVALVFDEVLGRIVNIGRPIARTAYLKTDFKAIAPIGRRLRVRAWWVSEEGRKRLVRADLRDGETVCAEAEALFVTLRPGQP